MARKIRPWDAADTLETKEDIAAYLDAVLEDGDPDVLKAALGDIARARGMTEIAQAAGLGRANLYKALSSEGNPEFATVVKVLRALGLRFLSCCLTGAGELRARFELTPVSGPCSKRITSNLGF